MIPQHRSKPSNRSWLITILALFSVVYGSNVSAAPILDQQYVPLLGNDGVIISSSQSLTQTFTVGISGLLSSVDVQIARRNTPPSDDLTLSIVSAPGGTPNPSAVLATASITPAQISPGFTFVPVDVSASMLNVFIGQQLGIRLTTSAPGTGGGINPYAWRGDVPGGYVGGTPFINGNISPVRDWGFRTFVDPQVQQVPEPSSLALLAGGIVALGGWSRRRRR